MKQIVCVHLRQWPIDRLRRKHSQYQHKQYLHKPVVLIESTGTKQTVAVVSNEARTFGIQSGMALVQARALCADLLDAPHDVQRDAESIYALARWLMQFSPTVAVELPNGLFLDVTGSERLFDGWERLISKISKALRSKSILATTAMAPTPGAAWGLAFAGCDQFMVKAEPLSAIISELPIESLRLDSQAVTVLHSLGIDTCGQLLRLPRETIPCRFGDNVLKRIDQALGIQAEPLVSVKIFSPVAATMEFETEIESLEIIQLALKRLLDDQIVPELVRRGCGTKRIEISFRVSKLSPILKTLRLSRASWNAKKLFQLAQLASESSFCDNGFVGIRIVAKELELLTAEQIDLMEQEDYVCEIELDQLIERLRLMSGERSIAQPRLVASHIPEHAFELTEPDSTFSTTDLAVHNRPPRLVHPPSEIGVMVAPTTEGPPLSFNVGGHIHRVAYALGPERIAGRWWSGNNKTRDYFEIEDEAGQRFWVFRVLETSKWYLHGSFD